MEGVAGSQGQELFAQAVGDEEEDVVVRDEATGQGAQTRGKMLSMRGVSRP
jgi:hypothetical protein